jgi:hypothetical protein
VHGVVIDVDMLDGSGIGHVVVEHDETSAVECEVVISPFVSEHLGGAALSHPAGMVEDVSGLMVGLEIVSSGRREDLLDWGDGRSGERLLC